MASSTADGKATFSFTGPCNTTEMLTAKAFRTSGVNLPNVLENSGVYKENTRIEKIRAHFRNVTLREPRFEPGLKALSALLTKKDGVRMPNPIIKLAGTTAFQAEDLIAYRSSKYELEPRFFYPPSGSLQDEYLKVVCKIHGEELAPNNKDWEKKLGRQMDVHLTVISTLGLSDMIRRIDHLEGNYENKSSDEIFDDTWPGSVYDSEVTQESSFDEPGTDLRSAVEWEFPELKGVESTWKPDSKKTGRSRRAGRQHPQKVQTKESNLYGEQTSQLPDDRVAVKIDGGKTKSKASTRAANMNPHDSILLEDEGEGGGESVLGSSIDKGEAVEIGEGSESEGGIELKDAEAADDSGDANETEEEIVVVHVKKGMGEMKAGEDEERYARVEDGESEDEVLEDAEDEDDGFEEDEYEEAEEDEDEEVGEDMNDDNDSDAPPPERYVSTRLSDACADRDHYMARVGALETQVGQVQQKVEDLNDEIQADGRNKRRAQDALAKSEADNRRLRQILRRHNIDFSKDGAYLNRPPALSCIKTPTTPRWCSPPVQAAMQLRMAHSSTWRHRTRASNEQPMTFSLFIDAFSFVYSHGSASACPTSASFVH